MGDDDGGSTCIQKHPHSEDSAPDGFPTFGLTHFLLWVSSGVSFPYLSLPLENGFAFLTEYPDPRDPACRHCRPRPAHGCRRARADPGPRPLVARECRGPETFPAPDCPSSRCLCRRIRSGCREVPSLPEHCCPACPCSSCERSHPTSLGASACRRLCSYPPLPPSFLPSFFPSFFPSFLLSKGENGSR